MISGFARSVSLRRLSRSAAAVGLATFAAVTLPAAAHANLPAGSYVLNGSVSAIEQVGGYTYVGGIFFDERRPTGGGVTAAAAGDGALDATLPAQVAGTVKVVIPDGSGGWFIGGRFATVGGAAHKNLAHIGANGGVDAGWSAGTDSTVFALSTSGGVLYVGGAFKQVDGVARANAAAVSTATGALTAWDPEPDNFVNAIAAAPTHVYLGGSFQNVGGGAHQGLAVVSTSTGSAAAFPDVTGGSVNALQLVGSTLYLGGSFTQLEALSKAGLAAIDVDTNSLTAWNPNPTGSDNGGSSRSTINALVVDGSTVYVGGDFRALGGTARNELGAVDASTGAVSSWNPSASRAPYRVNALAVGGGRVYVAGAYFSNNLTTPATGTLAYDAGTGGATTWNPQITSETSAIAVSGAEVYIGGGFVGAGAPIGTITNLARIAADGSLDTGWAPNPDSSVFAMTHLGSRLYIGGFFQRVGGLSRGLIAAVDANTGATLAFNPGVNNTVLHMAAVGNTVYATGYFTTAGGQGRTNAAAFDATTGAVTSWSPPNGSSAWGLAADATGVYLSSVGQIGGQHRDGLAKVDGTTGAVLPWNPTLVGSASSLVLAGQTVFAGGGAFDAWTGAARPDFTPLPSEPAQGAIASDGVRLYGVAYPTGNIVDGLSYALRGYNAATGASTGWSAVASGSVSALAVSGSTVLLGGSFGYIDGRLTGPFAKLSDLSPLGAVPTPTPTSAATPAPTPTLTPAATPGPPPSEPNPTPDPVPAPTGGSNTPTSGTNTPSGPSAVPITPAPSPTRALVAASITGGSVRLVAFSVKPTKAGKCPKTATETLTSGSNKVKKSVKVRTLGDACTVYQTVKLTGALKKAKQVKVTVSGKGLHTSSVTLQP